MGGKGGADSPRQRVLADRVRQRRHDLGLTQEELANRVGLARAYVGILETGHRCPNLDTLARLAVGLEWDMADLVRGLQAVPGRRTAPGQPSP